MFHEFESKLQKALEVKHPSTDVMLGSLPCIAHGKNASAFGRGHTTGTNIKQPVARLPRRYSLRMVKSHIVGRRDPSRYDRRYGEEALPDVYAQPT